MAVAAKEPERVLADMNHMMEKLTIVADRGGKHKKGCVDSQDSFNRNGRPNISSLVRDRLKDKIDPKQKEGLKKAAAAFVAENPAPQDMHRAVQRPIGPTRRVPPPPRAPPRLLNPPWFRPAPPENFEAEVDSGRPLLPLLKEMEEEKEKLRMVQSIIERQVMAEHREETITEDFMQQAAAPTVVDFCSRNTSSVSIDGSLDSANELLSPHQSSGSSPPSVYTLQHVQPWADVPSCSDFDLDDIVS